MKNFSKIMLCGLIFGFGSSANAEKNLLLKNPVDAQAFSINTQVQSGDSILQFQDAMPVNAKGLLKSYGLEVFSYLPEDAFIVRGSAEQFLQIQNALNVKVLKYTSQMKLSREFSPQSIFNAERLTLASVTLHDAKFVNLVQSAMTQLGARVLSIDNRTLVVSLKNSNLVRLSNVE
ncbi:MAG: hypothetical protein AB7O96_19050 [Pseudobdellovibrionaceae bacterium]